MILTVSFPSQALHQWYEDQTADPSLPAHNNEAAPADQAEGGATAAAGAMRNSEGAPAAAEAQAGSSGVAGPSAAAVDERDAGEAGTSAGEADASAIVGAGNAGASMSAAAAEDAAANKKGPRGAKHTLRERKVAQPQSKGERLQFIEHISGTFEANLYDRSCVCTTWFTSFTLSLSHLQVKACWQPGKQRLRQIVRGHLWLLCAMLRK